VSSFLTAHQHIEGHFMVWDGRVSWTHRGCIPWRLIDEDMTKLLTISHNSTRKFYRGYSYRVLRVWRIRCSLCQTTLASYRMLLFKMCRSLQVAFFEALRLDVMVDSLVFRVNSRRRPTRYSVMIAHQDSDLVSVNKPK